MFPNNFNMPYYQPYGNIGITPGLRGGLGAVTRGGGLFSRLTGGLGGTRGINWRGLLNNASRTLNVINQAIPIVKQVGPMYNNMKSMLKVASLFKDETDPDPKDNKLTNKSKNTNNNTSNITEKKENTIITNNYSNSPNFFI